MTLVVSKRARFAVAEVDVPCPLKTSKGGVFVSVFRFFLDFHQKFWILAFQLSRE
jgi:hypothetical protein